MRLLRFVRNLWWARRFIVHCPVDRHNIRAAWIQSDPHWFAKLEPLFGPDEQDEADAFIKAMEELQ